MNQFFATVLFVAAGFLGSVPENTKQLVDSGQFEQAYEYAQQWRDDYEGVPDFDLYYGVAALETGRLSEAAIALDRVLMLQPSNHRARVEYGRVMFLMRDYTAAEQAFSDVMSSRPPAPVQKRVQAFMDSITARQKARKSSASVTLEMKGGYNTNINSATSAGTTTDLRLFDVPLRLLESDQKTESAFVDSKATLNVSRPITEKRVQYLTLGYQDITNEETDDYNIDIFNVGAGYMFNLGSSQVRFPLGYQAVSIDNEFTQSFLSVGVDSVTPIDRQNDWINFALLGAKRFKDDHLRDTDLAMAGTGWGYVMADIPVKLVGSVFLGEDHARKQKSQGNTFGGVRAALEYHLNLEHVLYANALYQESRYHAPGVFVEKRRDRVSEGITGWRWQLARNASVTAELSYTDNESSLTIFTFDRFKSQIGFVYVFD